MTVSEVVQLEQQLLLLGQQELELERKLDQLKTRTRNAVDANNLALADELWSAYETARKGLASLRSKISAVESTLYRLRRNRSF